MSPENVILMNSESGTRIVSHLRNVAEYVSKLGPNLKVESYTRVERLPLSRFLPLPHSSTAPYRAVVTFTDEKGERYAAIFSGEIGFETHGLAAPQCFTSQSKECVDSFIYTVFEKSPDTVQKLLKP